MHMCDKVSLKSSQNKSFFGQKLYRTSKHISLSVTFIFENYSVYEIIGNNFVHPDRPHDNPGHSHCVLNKTTNTCTQYVIHIPFPLQQQLHQTASILRYTYIACPVPLTCTPLKRFFLNQNSTLSRLKHMHS